MTFSLRQAGTGGPTSPNVNVTLASAPVSGNLLVAFIFDRSGGTSATIQGTGWTQQIHHPEAATDSTYRKYVSVWTKIAGASEPSTITMSSGVMASGIVTEFQSNSGQTLTFQDAVSLGVNAATAFFDTGSTVNIAASPLLLVGIAALKQGDNVVAASGTWSDGMTTVATKDESNNSRDLVVALTESASGGVKSFLHTCTPAAQAGGIAGLLAFSIGSGAAPPNSGTASGSYAYAGTATGSAPAVPPSTGTASGTVDWAGTAAGATPAVAPAEGTAAGSYAFDGSASGSAPVVPPAEGSASGTYLYSGVATGAAPTLEPATGSAAGAVDWSATAVGSAPTIGAAEGTATGTYAFDGTAAGDNAIPDVPANLTAVQNGYYQVDLAWDAVDGASAYDIERNGTVLVTDHPVTTYSDTAVSPSIEYTYRVRAVR